MGVGEGEREIRAAEGDGDAEAAAAATPPEPHRAVGKTASAVASYSLHVSIYSLNSGQKTVLIQ